MGCAHASSSALASSVNDQRSINVRFKEEKSPGLLGLVVVQTEVGQDDKPLEADNPFQIRADKGGIQFRGTSRRIESRQDLEDFAKAMDRAWRAHMAAKPKVLNEAGH